MLEFAPCRHRGLSLFFLIFYILLLISQQGVEFMKNLFNLIQPAHSMDVTFYALSTDGYLMAFVTQREGVLPVKLQLHSVVKPKLREVARECFSESCAKREQYLALKPYLYIYRRKQFNYGSKFLARQVLEGQLDIKGNVFLYEQVQGAKKDERIRDTFVRHLNFLPVLEPRQRILFDFDESIAGGDTVHSYVVEKVVKYLVGISKNFWRELKSEFPRYNLGKAEFAVINCKEIPASVLYSFFIVEPRAKFLNNWREGKRIFCVDFKDVEHYENEIKILKIMLESSASSKVKRGVVIVNNSDKFLKFCRKFYKTLKGGGMKL